MSKSLDNHIELAATPEETTARVMKMVTDPQRQRRTDPGRPEVCNVFSLHKMFSSPEQVAEIDIGCRTATLGCVQCKQLLAHNLNEHLAPFRARRAELAQHPAEIEAILADGQQRAQAIAAETMREVRDAIGLPALQSVVRG
jgi:tryptophanyl-tRNA synthetase